jgi:deoxyguanosine kinase
MWLAVEGVVGAGKTTASSLIGESSGLVMVEERAELHPFLADYYEDPRQFAFETELAFMLIQLRELKTIVAPGGVVSDFAPAKNLIFARLQAGEADVALLETVDARLWRDLPRPDVVVYLDLPLEVCLRRIAERGREYEQGLTLPDLERIEDAYRRSLESLGQEVRKLELDGREPPEEVATGVMDLAGVARTDGRQCPELDSNQRPTP